MSAVAIDVGAAFERQCHLGIGFDRADAVDARDRGHDDDVIRLLQQRARCRMAHPVYLLVDGRILLDERVGLGDIGFGLVIVVIGDEILDIAFREKGFHLAVELRGECLVMRHDERRALRLLDDMRHGEGFARSGDAQQHLVALLLLKPLRSARRSPGAGRLRAYNRKRF